MDIFKNVQFQIFQNTFTPFFFRNSFLPLWKLCSVVFTFVSYYWPFYHNRKSRRLKLFKNYDSRPQVFWLFGGKWRRREGEMLAEKRKIPGKFKEFHKSFLINLWEDTKKITNLFDKSLRKYQRKHNNYNNSLRRSQRKYQRNP